ncbi:MAG: threonylcarbamoyl-AMP synthase [Deltaproteobacteria bacterium]|nr:threonylcarbamoyl-AMP synthase [Deltaproteobacteria bacterium]
MTSNLQLLIREAAQTLSQGELVVFPTETVYGLGARADSAAAIQKIYQAKGRPQNNPLIVHFHSMSQMKEWIKLPEQAQKLGNKFWPGPLTLIVQGSERICKEARAGLKTVAIRIPNHPIALELLREVDIPLAAPSANRSGHISPTQVEHVKRSLGPQVEIILEGGPCEVGLESTVLDLTTKPPRILRPGKILREEIENEIGPVDLIDQKLHASETLASPGLLSKHYAPEAKVLLMEGSEIEYFCRPHKDDKVAIIFHSADLKSKLNEPDNLKKIYLSNNPSNYAQQLYSTLYQLENSGYNCIIIEALPQEPQWQAIANRVSRMI